MVRAVGQAGERLAAAEEEFRAGGIADRPVTGGLVQFEQRQPLAHRHHVVEGDRIGLQLDLEGVGERGVAARDRTGRHPHHRLGGTRLALARRGGRGGLGAAGQAQPVNLSDHRISRHVAEFRSDLAGREAGFPELLQLLDAIIGPGQYRHRMFPFASRRPIQKAALRGQIKKSLRAESLKARRTRWSPGREHALEGTLKGSELPHEMSYPMAQTLQYGVTPAQESAPMRPHVPMAVGRSIHIEMPGVWPSCSALRRFRGD